MIYTEVTRILSAWARHPEHGVNAQMSFVGRKRMDGKDDPKVPAVTIYDDIDSDGGSEPDQALEIDPAKVPALVIWCVGSGEFNMHDVNYQRSGEEVIVAFAYITRDVTGRKAKRDGGYTLRATKRCLYRFKNAPAESKTLNGVKVLQIGRITPEVVAGGTGPSEMWGLLAASVTVVDHNL